MNISLGSINTLFVTLLRRYHVIIFTIIIIGGLGLAIYLLSGIVNQPIANGSTPAASTFDKTTIEKIQQLKTTADSVAPLDGSKGRVNPFVE